MGQVPSISWKIYNSCCRKVVKLRTS